MNMLSRALRGAPLTVEAIERDALWRGMRYRVGKKFVGLDVAGNPCLYLSYRRIAFGGWGPVTIADLQTPDATKVGGFALLVEKQPMHSKCVPLLENHLKTLKQKQSKADAEWCEVLKKRHSQIIEGFEKEEASGKPSASPSMPSQPPPIDFKYEMHKALRNKKICRLNRFATFAYKCVYFGLMGALVLLFVGLYKRFKVWLNPPARQGLNNIEKSVLYYPRSFWFWVEDNFLFPFFDFIDAEEDSTRPSSVLLSATRNILRPIVDSARDAYDTVTGITAMDNAQIEAEERVLAVRQQSAMLQKQSNRLRELFGFLFLLVFVLLML